MEYLGEIFGWNASTVFRPVWLQEPYLALDRIWALLHQRPEQANAATPEGKPMTLAVKKGTGEHNDTTTHHEAVEHLGHFCGVFDPRCCDSSLHFCDDSVINPLEVQSFRWLQCILWENIDSRKKEKQW